MALIEGAGILQTHYKAQKFCNTPHSWRSSASCPLSVPWPQVTPAISSITEKVTICHCHHGSTSLFSPRLSTSKGGLAPRWPWGPPERASALPPHPRLGVGHPSCPDGWVPALSGHQRPHSHVTRSHPSLFTQCPDEHLKSVLKGLCTYSLSFP